MRIALLLIFWFCMGLLPASADDGRKISPDLSLSPDTSILELSRRSGSSRSEIENLLANCGRNQQPVFLRLE